MEDALRLTIECIHQAPHHCVVAVTGAGSRAIAWLLEVPGASGTLLEARVPYAEAALVEFLGERPAHFVSPETAEAMAWRACERAEALSDGTTPLLGVGCTAALTTNRRRRGPEHAHVAVVGEGRCARCSLTFAKGARTREEEEDLCSRVLIRALALRSGVLPAFDVPLLPGEELECVGALSPVADLLDGRAERLLLSPEGRFEAGGEWRGGVLSGAFNPLHEGHRRLAAAAAKMLGAEVAFELSVRNVDKPPLSEAEALRRARQFLGFAALLLTRVPTFREKARLLPGCVFVIGYDAAVRLFAPRYYGGEGEMLAALREIGALGCSFLVAGRIQEGAYHTLADVEIPEEFRGLLREIPEDVFRMDLSSTELRERGA